MEVLLGCWQEASRADKVAAHLDRVRNTLGVEFFEHITALYREILSSSRLLRDVFDIHQFYRSRVGMIAYYLDVLLPTFFKTLQQMLSYLENTGISTRTQWTLMYERMGEQGGMSLAARFVMFVDFLVQIIRLLGRSPLYDPTTMELLRMRHMRLRTLQGIPAPQPPVQQIQQPQQRALMPLIQPAPPPPELEPPNRSHWAERVFNDQPHSATGLQHRRESKCFGPIMVDVKLGITPGSTVLFKLPFDKNRLSITLCLQPEGPNLTRFLCRWMDKYFNPLYSCYGVHELCVRRKGSSLQLRRWSATKMHPTLWGCLFFKTWEKMVLFHCAFGALKSRCPLTLNVMPDDVVLAGEKRLYQGKIVDDGFEHILTVLQDEKCGGIRLHAAVRGGELKKCPVWTAFGKRRLAPSPTSRGHTLIPSTSILSSDLDLPTFTLINLPLVTYQSASPNWLDRRSRHRIWLRDIHPYVFCQKYRKKHQMKKHGEFELYFMNEEAADAFQDIFSEETEGSHVVQVLEMSGGNGPGPRPENDDSGGAAGSGH